MPLGTVSQGSTRPRRNGRGMLQNPRSAEVAKLSGVARVGDRRGGQIPLHRGEDLDRQGRESNAGHGKKPRLTKWRSRAAMIAAPILYIVRPVEEMWGGASVLFTGSHGGGVCDAFRDGGYSGEETAGSRYHHARRRDVYGIELTFVPVIAMDISGEEAAGSRCPQLQEEWRV